jgi:hypothetical protein
MSHPANDQTWFRTQPQQSVESSDRSPFNVTRGAQPVWLSVVAFAGNDPKLVQLRM